MERGQLESQSIRAWVWLQPAFDAADEKKGGPTPMSKIQPAHESLAPKPPRSVTTRN